jgi:hypothetical protein
LRCKGGFADKALRKKTVAKSIEELEKRVADFKALTMSAAGVVSFKGKDFSI